MTKVIQIAVTIAVFVATSVAQPPSPQREQGRGVRSGQTGEQPAPPRSAEVSAHGRVTFRLAAPKATEVVLNGNWQGGRGVAMTKEASGNWTVTTGPLDPGVWNYTFSVNGVTTLDTGNYSVVRDGRRYMNSVLVPGAAAALLQTSKIPHGTVSAVWYPSSALQAGRRTLVYTPAGYEGSKYRYPVLYLFHGGGGDEEAWSSMGSVNVILDNLIAQGKARPMVVVMPNANWNETAALDVGGPPGGRHPAIPVQDYDRAEKEIVGNIIPFVEKNYRVQADRENRAIAGLSMGGGIAINVGLKRPDIFATVAQFSSGLFGGSPGYAPFEIEKIFPGHGGDRAATNKKLKLLFFSCGTEDPRMPFHRKVVEDLRARSINLTFREYAGSHEWKVWRDSLADLAPMLFR